METKNVIADLLKSFGVVNVMKMLTAGLRKMGHAEERLAREVDEAVERYNRGK
jgi:hypothetical protein